MSKKDWTERMRKRMEDYEMAPTDDLWDRIEAGLDAAEGKKGIVERNGRRHSAIVWLRRCGVAAAVAGLCVLGWQSYHVEPDGQVVVKADSTHSEGVGRSDEREMAAVENRESTVVGEKVVPGTRRGIIRLASGDRAKHADADGRPVDVDAATEHAEEIAAVPTQENNEGNPPSETDRTQTEVIRMPVPERPSTTYASVIEKPHAGHRGRSVELSVYGSNGFSESRQSNGVEMTGEMANSYYGLMASLKRGAPMPKIYLSGYEERSHHHRPVSMGLSVGVPMGRRLTLTTGLTYTKLDAEFLKIMPKNRILKEQELYYVGLPVNMNYRMDADKWVTVYAATGIAADLNVKAKTATEGVETEMPKDKPQFSMQVAVGMQINVTPQVGLYVEPGVKYYFDNGSTVSTFFKEKPCSFNLQLGVRWNIDK